MDNHRHNDDNVDMLLVQLCPNCDDGCLAELECAGCGQVLCYACWDEHNNNAPCHVAN